MDKDSYHAFVREVAFAALHLSYHNTDSLLRADLLSSGRRRESAAALEKLLAAAEALADSDNRDSIHSSLRGVRRLIDRLNHQ